MIEPQLVRRRIVGHVDVSASIAVEIRAHHAEPRSIRPVDSRSFRYVLKLSVAQISKQASRHGLVHLGRAVVGFARRRGTATIALDCEIDIVADEKIEIPVAIEIHPRGASRPVRIIDAGFARDIGEGTVAIIVIEHVAAEVGHVEIEEAVVIIVAGSHAHAIADVSHSGFFSDVDESQLTRFGQQIFEQPVARFPAGRGREERFAAVEGRALHQIDVQVAVVIVVEQRHAGTHDLGHVVTPGGTVEVMKVETGLRGHVAENRRLIGRADRQWNAACRQRLDGGSLRAVQRLQIAVDACEQLRLTMRHGRVTCLLNI